MLNEKHFLSFVFGLTVAYLGIYLLGEIELADNNTVALTCAVCPSFEAHFREPVSVMNCTPLAILGIFSTVKETERRTAIRTTIFTDPYVCASNTTCCQWLLPRFIIGGGNATRTALSAEMAQHRDIEVLEMEENMNAGKRHAWYTYAAKHFPTASFIGKIDTDTIFDPAVLAGQLTALRGFPNVAFGPYVDYFGCGQMHHCTFFTGVYLSGSFSMLSSNIVHWIANASNPAVKDKIVGIEDLLVGVWLEAGQRSRDLAPVLWALYSSYDPGERSSPPYLHIHGGAAKNPANFPQLWAQIRPKGNPA